MRDLRFSFRRMYGMFHRKTIFLCCLFPGEFLFPCIFIVPCDIFLTEVLWNRLAGAWGRSLQRYLKSVCPSSALVMVNSFMVSSCIEKKILRDFLIGVPFWCCWYITPTRRKGQVNHFYASFCSLIKQITKADRRLTEERVSFLPFVSLPRASILHH